MPKKSASLSRSVPSPSNTHAISTQEALIALGGALGAAQCIANALDVSDTVSLNELFDAIAVARLTLLRLEENEL